MRKAIRFLGSIVLCVFFIVGCATSGKWMNLKLHMTKSEVISTIGKPAAVPGSMTNRYGQVIEVWEYTQWKGGGDGKLATRTTYWLYFYNGKLVQWGEAGDWQREADRIYETRFR